MAQLPYQEYDIKQSDVDCPKVICGPVQKILTGDIITISFYSPAFYQRLENSLEAVRVSQSSLLGASDPTSNRASSVNTDFPPPTA